MTDEHVDSLPLGRRGNRAARRRFWEDFHAAMALDPDWEEIDGRSYCWDPDALYDTPEKLVAAYRAWRDGTGTGVTLT
jgi:hypothetical protein